MVIKHLFIGGGCFYGFSFFGVLKQSAIQKIWSLSNIKTIHGISAGALIATMISLNIDWDILTEYLIDRPWNKLFQLNMYSTVNSIQNCGIFGKSEFDEILKPIFLSKDLSCDITMQQFYEYTGIEQYYYITKINGNSGKIESILVSFKTHPDWKLFDVIYWSSCLPILFSPMHLEDGNIYLDGIFGIYGNPIENLLSSDSGIVKEELMTVVLQKPQITPLAISSASLFDYLVHIFLCIFLKNRDSDKVTDYTHNFIIERDPFNIETIFLVLDDKNERVRLVDLGIKTFLSHPVGGGTGGGGATTHFRIGKK
jgi:hypothetical protein